jgi:hypothetical protein
LFVYKLTKYEAEKSCKLQIIKTNKDKVIIVIEHQLPQFSVPDVLNLQQALSAFLGEKLVEV